VIAWLADILKISFLTGKDGIKRAQINGKIIDNKKYDFGSCRDLYLYHDLIIKTDRDKYDDYNDCMYAHQCISEISLWPQIDEKDRAFFCALQGFGVTNEGAIWVAQEYQEQDNHWEYKDLEERFNIIKKVVKKYDLDNDVKLLGSGPNNWGIFDGQPKIYDWGWSWGCSRDCMFCRVYKQ